MDVRPDLGRVPTGRSGEATETAVDDLAMIVGTGGTTGRPEGRACSPARNLETMTAITLMSYPFQGRPVYLALAPLTHAAGVLCFPVLALGGEIVVMREAGPRRRSSALVERHRRHPHLPAADADLHAARHTPELEHTDLSSLQCFWYGAAPMSAARLEQALGAIGPVMAQLFGQTEAPMMISTMPPRRALPRRRHARARAAVLGRAAGAAGHRRDHGPRTARCCRARRARRDRRPRLAGDGAATTRTRWRPRRRPGTAGTTPATSATSTRTTTCSSSTGPRT